MFSARQDAPHPDATSCSIRLVDVECSPSAFGAGPQMAQRRILLRFGDFHLQKSCHQGDQGEFGLGLSRGNAPGHG